MEEIKLDQDNEIDIPIHRAQEYDDGLVDENSLEYEQDLVDTIINSSPNASAEEITDNDTDKQKAKTTEAIDTNKKDKTSGDIEELQLDQSIKEEKEYVMPSINLLVRPTRKGKFVSDKTLKETTLKLQETLESFGVGVSINNVSCGPSVTRYELQPEQGVKVSKITSLIR